MNPLKPPSPLTLRNVNGQVCAVHTADGIHVGNLKLISGVWKFKAIGHEEGGHVVPGGGPLSLRHNTIFAELDEALVSAALLR
ncbi:MAG: hypothetical protein H7228_14940 [Polaromonas sp.]|nr:hypothetical protein [Polaromonas sp.]